MIAGVLALLAADAASDDLGRAAAFGTAALSAASAAAFVALGIALTSLE